MAKIPKSKSKLKDSIEESWEQYKRGKVISQKGLMKKLKLTYEIKC